MSYRRYLPPQPLLIGYDPFRDLPPDHLARLVEQVVEETVQPPRRDRRAGQPPYDPRLCVKVLVYGYATGVRSSRQLERHCKESLPYLFLTRGDAPSYRTLCTARTEQGAFLEAVWEGLFAIAAAVGLERLGKIVVDSTKIRANASPEAVLKREECAAVRAELERILAEAAQVDAREAQEGATGRTELGKMVPREQMRDILRRVRRQRRQEGRSQPPDPEARGGAGEAGHGGAGHGGAGSSGAGSSGAGSSGAGRLPLEGLPRSAAPSEEAPSQGTPPEEATGSPAARMSPKMLQQVATGLQAIQEAEAEGRKHLCLTDPDARMMGGGRERQIRECYSFEVAVDAGLLVAGLTSQSGNDNGRLEPLVEAARKHEPEGVLAVTADSGYYAGDAVGRLIEAGIDTCVPDPNTAGDLHRQQPIGTVRAQGRGSVPFTYEAATDCYHCPEGNVLVATQQRTNHGQQVTVYRAQEDCRPCPQAAACLTQPHAKRRTLNVGQYQEALEAARQRFATPEYQERYAHRGEAVETVFGFVRGTLGYVRWSLRGAKKVACEGSLFKTAYQLRKVHRAWAAA